MSSIWLGRFYYVFGFLFVVLVLLVIVCAEVFMVLTYMHLCVEDWQWWWKSFFASGSVALYVFLLMFYYCSSTQNACLGLLADYYWLGIEQLLNCAHN